MPCEWEWPFEQHGLHAAKEVLSLLRWICLFEMIGEGNDKKTKVPGLQGWTWNRSSVPAGCRRIENQILQFCMPVVNFQWWIFSGEFSIHHWKTKIQFSARMIKISLIVNLLFQCVIFAFRSRRHCQTLAQWFRGCSCVLRFGIWRHLGRTIVLIMGLRAGNWRSWIRWEQWKVCQDIACLCGVKQTAKTKSPYKKLYTWFKFWFPRIQDTSMNKCWNSMGPNGMVPMPTGWSRDPGDRYMPGLDRNLKKIPTNWCKSYSKTPSSRLELRAPGCHLVITPEGCSRRQSKVSTANCTLALHWRVGRASTNTGRFLRLTLQSLLAATCSN